MVSLFLKNKVATPLFSKSLGLFLDQEKAIRSHHTDVDRRPQKSWFTELATPLGIRGLNFNYLIGLFNFLN